jgi:hypothetical protein
MTICPINIVDYESSLIAADWYEEQGMQDYADSLREGCNYLNNATAWKHRLRFSRCIARTAYTRRLSGCSTSWKMYPNFPFSSCNSMYGREESSHCDSIKGRKT